MVKIAGIVAALALGAGAAFAAVNAADRVWLAQAQPGQLQNPAAPNGLSNPIPPGPSAGTSGGNAAPYQEPQPQPNATSPQGQPTVPAQPATPQAQPPTQPAPPQAQPSAPSPAQQNPAAGH